MRADLRHASSILAAYANPPDVYEWSVWERHLRPGDLFIDVGANVGIYSIMAAELGCRVIAFEPDPENREALTSNIALNGYQDRIRVVPMAVSDAEGTVRFLVGRDALGRVSDDMREEAVDVPCTTLDEVVKESIAGIKIDVEGAEHLVLRGAREHLAAHGIAMLQIEWNEFAEVNFLRSRDDDSDLLASFGYELFRPGGDGTMVVFDGQVGADVFALPGKTATDA